MKMTCLWLRGLPPLIHVEQNELFFSKTHTNKPAAKYICQGKKSKGKKIYFVESNPGKKARSRTFPGIAAAMAEQWGDL